LSELVIRKTDFSSELLNELRGEIDEIDDRFVSLLSRRMEIAREIGLYKIDHDMPVLQPARYERMVTGRVLQYSGEETERQFLRQLLEAIHEESVRQQLEIFNGGHKKH
ncbi:MAG: chorismate mutase, partial [Bacteroidales bacterium]|nr:chorismate mutase [Bacteroidales bacterium]